MILYSEIHKRAGAGFTVSATDPTFMNKWIVHWLATAEAFRRESAAEGLTETAQAIRAIINDQRKYVPLEAKPC